MAKNEDGEFELVLGNKELLSVLFITVVLLGVFFAMGFIVGRSSAPIETAGRPEPYVRTSAPTPGTERETPRPEQAAEAKSAESTPTASQPAETKPDTPVASSSPESTKPVEVAPVGLVEPQAGQTYLQVTASQKAEAEILAELLIKKGFQAIVAPGPSDKLFRVLVGPAKDQPEIARMKSDLEGAGFKQVFIRKY